MCSAQEEVFSSEDIESILARISTGDVRSVRTLPLVGSSADDGDELDIDEEADPGEFRLVLESWLASHPYGTVRLILQ